MRRARSSVAVLVVALLAAGCGSSAGSDSGIAGSRSASLDAAAAGVPLTVFAAASLKDALGAAVAAYAAAVPGATFTVSTDSSAALETQIEQGAPADLFLSADTANPGKLVAAGLAAGQPIVFARNRLVVIVPADNPARVRTPADLAGPGVKVIAAGEQVPITKYATQLVQNLATQPGYPAGFAAAYAANVVSREDNVRAVIAKVELGEGDAAIVYATDAASSTKVAAIPVPDAANVTATDAGVVVGASAQAAAAHAFLAWLAGPGGQAILARFGFESPPS